MITWNPITGCYAKTQCMFLLQSILSFLYRGSCSPHNLIAFTRASGSQKYLFTSHLWVLKRRSVSKMHINNPSVLQHFNPEGSTPTSPNSLGTKVCPCWTFMKVFWCALTERRRSRQLRRLRRVGSTIMERPGGIELIKFMVHKKSHFIRRLPRLAVSFFRRTNEERRRRRRSEFPLARFDKVSLSFSSHGEKEEEEEEHMSEQLRVYWHSGLSGLTWLGSSVGC